MHAAHQPPRMVTCELSRVWCCLRRRQHNMRHMQITRVKEKLVKSRKRPSAPFAKRSVGSCSQRDLDAWDRWQHHHFTCPPVRPPSTRETICDMVLGHNVLYKTIRKRKPPWDLRVSSAKQCTNTRGGPGVRGHTGTVKRLGFHAVVTVTTTGATAVAVTAKPCPYSSSDTATRPPPGAAHGVLRARHIVQYCAPCMLRQRARSL